MYVYDLLLNAVNIVLVHVFLLIFKLLRIHLSRSKIERSW